MGGSDRLCITSPWCIYVLTLLYAVGASGSLPPDPDNAALLYYQAVLARPEPDLATYASLLMVTFGADPNERIRRYMRDSRDAIRFTDAATRVPLCNWGILYSQGDSLRTMLGRLEQLVLLLEVDAWIFAADGDYRSGLDRALSIRRFAGHLADETIFGYGVSLRTHETALAYIQNTLGNAASDRDTLLWLDAQISEVQGPPKTPGKQVESTLEQTLQAVRAHPDAISTWRRHVAYAVTDEATKGKLLSLTDEDALERAKESCDRFVPSVQVVIASERPYDQKRAELERLVDELQDMGSEGNPIWLAFVGVSVKGLIVTQYDIYMRCLARYNAVRAAIELCIERMKTGQFPPILPAYLPKDPFSGQDFEYQVADAGFILRCRGKDISEDKIWEYEFKVGK